MSDHQDTPHEGAAETPIGSANTMIFAAVVLSLIAWLITPIFTGQSFFLAALDLTPSAWLLWLVVIVAHLVVMQLSGMGLKSGNRLWPALAVLILGVEFAFAAAVLFIAVSDPDPAGLLIFDGRYDVGDMDEAMFEFLANPDILVIGLGLFAVVLAAKDLIKGPPSTA